MLTARQQRLVDTLTKVQEQPVQDTLPTRGFGLAPSHGSPTERSEVVVYHHPLSDIHKRHVHTLSNINNKGMVKDTKGENREGAPNNFRKERIEVAQQQEKMPTIGGTDYHSDDDIPPIEVSENEGDDKGLHALGLREDKMASELTVVLNDDESYSYSNGITIDPAKYRPVFMRANIALFNYLDEFHVNVENTDNETYQYNAIDVTVVNRMEIPVAINVAESSVQFEFKTREGDIGFGVVFAEYVDPSEEEEDGREGNAGSKKAPGMEFRTLYAERILRSDIPDEPIKGSFTLDEPGLLIFLFNNEHEWVADKHISYQIDVVAPVFRQPDDERCAISLPLLEDCIKDLTESHYRHFGAVEHIERNLDSVRELESAISSLAADLKSLQSDWSEAMEKMNLAKWVLAQCEQAKPGLCVRSLPKRALGHVLTFIPREAYRVCKYWNDLVCNHGLKFSDRCDLLDSSPRRRRINASNRETAALPFPGKPKAPRRRYPGMTGFTGSMSGHGIGQAFANHTDDNLKAGSSHKGGDSGEEYAGDSYWMAEKTGEGHPEDKEEASDDAAADSKMYSAEHFRSIYAYNEVPSSGSKAVTQSEKGDTSSGRASAEVSASTDNLSPRGYKPEDFAALYGAPGIPTPSFVEFSVPKAPASSKRDIKLTQKVSKERNGDDHIVVTNARTKTPSPSSHSAYHYQARLKVDSPSVQDQTQGQGQDAGDVDSLDDVVTPAKNTASSNDTLWGTPEHSIASRKLDPSIVVKQIDECFKRDEGFEAQREALKQKLSVWCQIFEEKRHRPPSVKEKRRLTKDLYAKYQEVRLQQARNYERINELLGSIGMSLSEYDQLGTAQE